MNVKVHMKKNFVFWVSSLVLAVSSVVQADTIQSVDSKSAPSAPVTLVQHLKTRVDLTDEQSAKITAIIENMAPKFKALREETDARIKGILTPAQMEKLKGGLEDKPLRPGRFDSVQGNGPTSGGR